MPRPRPPHRASHGCVAARVDHDAQVPDANPERPVATRPTLVQAFLRNAPATRSPSHRDLRGASLPLDQEGSAVRFPSRGSVAAIPSRAGASRRALRLAPLGTLRLRRSPIHSRLRTPPERRRRRAGALPPSAQPARHSTATPAAAAPCFARVRGRPRRSRRTSSRRRSGTVGHNTPDARAGVPAERTCNSLAIASRSLRHFAAARPRSRRGPFPFVRNLSRQSRSARALRDTLFASLRSAYSGSAVRRCNRDRAHRPGRLRHRADALLPSAQPAHRSIAASPAGAPRFA